MDRLFFLTVGVRSRYQRFQLVYEQVILIESWCALCYQCIQVVYERVILIDSW